MLHIINFSNYNIFLIHEKKYRIIMSESISDKIVNQMISYFILLPSFNCLIYMRKFFEFYNW